MRPGPGRGLPPPVTSWGCGPGRWLGAGGVWRPPGSRRRAREPPSRSRLPPPASRLPAPAPGLCPELSWAELGWARRGAPGGREEGGSELATPAPRSLQAPGGPAPQTGAASVSLLETLQVPEDLFLRCKFQRCFSPRDGCSLLSGLGSQSALPSLPSGA